MGDIVKKMDNKIPEVFTGHFIFLPANMTITAMDNGSAIQTIIFFSFRTMGHSEYFLKNKYIIYILYYDTPEIRLILIPK